jgi:hypothetical protein
MCALTSIAPRQVRLAAMRPFLGVLGFTKYSIAGGNRQSATIDVEWSETTAGKYAVVVVRRRGVHGLLVDAIRLEASCRVCG